MQQADESDAPRPALVRAAQTLAAVSGVAETVVDVVHGRALRHYGEGLRQYLAIRLADASAALDALADLRAVVAAKTADDLVKPPGLRAQLYRMARELAHRRREGPPSTDKRAALPWREVRGTATAAFRDAVQALRSGLGEADAELLELRHARELSPEEIAFVQDRSSADVVEHLEEATKRGAQLARVGSDEGELRAIVLEAFALEPKAEASKTTTDESSEPLPSGTVIGGRYELEKRVGSGAFAEVYRANDTEVPGHVVALKLLFQASLSENARAAALRELHLIASVFHPSVVQFKDHGWHEGRLWFVMPWYEGESLESRMERRALTRAEARRIFEPLARALATMHAVGIRHQDVKPDNIFLAKIEGFAQQGEEEILPVLLDLGVAAKEAEMVIAGTPTYFAPEVAAQFTGIGTENGTPITTKADVFSLALSLRNALEPETQEDVPAGAVETFIARRAIEPPDLPIDKDLRYLAPHFKRWLSLDPDKRPTADELADQLAVLTAPEEKRERRMRVLRWTVPLGLTLAVAFASVVSVLAARAEKQEMEAERARIAEAAMRENLNLSKQQQEQLEEDIDSLREEYAEGQLTRQQLAGKLARTESQLRLAHGTIEATERRRRAVVETLNATRQELEQTQSDLGRTRGELASERQRTAGLESEVARLRGELNEERLAAQQAQRRVAELDGRVAALEAQLAAARSQTERLEREMSEAVAARARAESELAAARERIARLERQLAERNPTGGPVVDDGTRPPPGPTATPGPGAQPI